VLGLSLVTNLAAGLQGSALAHTEVLAAGAEAAPRLGRLLRRIVEDVRPAS
jgi:purine-nucleoside phosphorylase